MSNLFGDFTSGTILHEPQFEVLYTFAGLYASNWASHPENIISLIGDGNTALDNSQLNHIHTSNPSVLKP